MNWNTTQTGKLYHSFENGKAVCNGRIKDTGFSGNAFETVEQVRERIATWRVGSLRNGMDVCGKCEAKEQAAAERAEASMAPSTGEGDHLPPARGPITRNQLAQTPSRHEVTQAAAQTLSSMGYNLRASAYNADRNVVSFMATDSEFAEMVRALRSATARIQAAKIQAEKEQSQTGYAAHYKVGDKIKYLAVPKARSHEEVTRAVHKLAGTQRVAILAISALASR